MQPELPSPSPSPSRPGRLLRWGLPRDPQAVPHLLALVVSAVIEDDSGALSYWALRHPPGKPDFHHPDAFAMELDEVRN